MDKKLYLQKIVTQKQLEQLAEFFFGSKDDLQDGEDEALVENIDDCLELAAHKGQQLIDMANVDIAALPIIFDHESDVVEPINNN